MDASRFHDARVPPRPPRSRAGGRRAALVGLLALGAAANVRCVGDLLDPAVPRAAYAFTPALRDTVVNVGDTTGRLACDLAVDGRPVACLLGLRAVVEESPVAIRGERIAFRRWGQATVEMRPLNVQLPVDTIVRFAQVRMVVPRLLWARPGSEDTIRSLSDSLMLIATPMTRYGQVITQTTGLPVTLVQESGATVAALIPGNRGWIRALSEGTAVFRGITDTATAVRRVVVRLSSKAGSGVEAATGGRLEGSRR